METTREGLGFRRSRDPLFEGEEFEATFAGALPLDKMELAPKKCVTVFSHRRKEEEAVYLGSRVNGYGKKEALFVRFMDQNPSEDSIHLEVEHMLQKDLRVDESSMPVRVYFDEGHLGGECFFPQDNSRQTKAQYDLLFMELEKAGIEIPGK
ncbi:hypothetical protein HN832_01525 [archaeon]|jgi:hypothetical protein|nr:hypothetical protein [archaeon]MBT4373936.1 hypothetical protein [archaeon]MBT4532329.1 hypothetical protein [archaeon]MBT7001915.1 hypothetical protein [archaeon]MBT7282072.1 hypothetical protein [archaeon]